MQGSGDLAVYFRPYFIQQVKKHKGKCVKFYYLELKKNACMNPISELLTDQMFL